jgi:calcyclin binding protein
LAGTAYGLRMGRWESNRNNENKTHNTIHPKTRAAPSTRHFLSPSLGTDALYPRTMVSFEEVPESNASEQISIPASQERLLDAQEIEEAAVKMKRPTARMQLEGLAKKLRKEGEALKRVEASRRTASEEDTTTALPPEEKPNPPPKAESISTPDVPVPSPSVPASSAAAASYYGNGAFVSIDRFSFDAGGYNAPFVSVYVTNLIGVGSIARDSIICDFTSSSFDLIVKDLNGKSYRLVKDHLEKDIDPDKSKIIVKADKVIVKLAKVKQGSYGGYDYWTKLTDTKAKSGKTKSKGADPQSSIMDLMKSMYDDGDDKMKKIIGETMMKQQQGGLDKDTDFSKDLGDGYDDM